jgi:antitoxin CptB
MSERDRILWHCRRGLLELDLVLAGFVARHLDRLDAPALAAFRELLDYPDNDLLDLVMGRADLAQEGECARVLLLLRETEALSAL